MSRMFLCCAALAVFTLPSRADQTVTSTEIVIRLTVQPMAAPKPALRYLLLPDLTEMNPGNPIQDYLKCFMEQSHFFHTKEEVERREKLLTMPLKDLPSQELLHYGVGRQGLQPDWAARLDKPDWQILLKLRTEGIYTLLPDLQEMRALAAALRVRFRAEVATHHFDSAIRTAKTMFALSRHVGEHPTFVGELVSFAIANVTIFTLEEMLEQPGCPNLYWALTNLPNPLISLEKGVEGERVMIAASLHDLNESAPMGEDQIKKTIASIEKLRKESDNGKTHYISVQAWLDARTKNEVLLNAAHRRLVEDGFPEERLKSFLAEQVILLDEWREFKVRRDEDAKLMNLPAWQVEALASQIKSNKGPASLFDFLNANYYKMRQSQGRLEQRIALLRHVEAFRMFAAEHDGKFPKTLAEVSVPLPVDPFTGKPFQYTVEETKVYLCGSPPPGREKEPAFNVRYELTIQK